MENQHKKIYFQTNKTKEKKKLYAPVKKWEIKNWSYTEIENQHMKYNIKALWTNKDNK